MSFGIDNNLEALEVARENARQLNLAVHFLHGDLLLPLIEKRLSMHILISNPPYIEDPKTIDPSVWKYEPHEALLANPGTLYYEKILKDASKVLVSPSLLTFEIAPELEGRLKSLVRVYFPQAGYNFEKDINGKTRFLWILVK